MSSSPAFAADGVPVIAQVINTGLLFALLIFLTRKPIVKSFTRRANNIKDDLEQAQIALKRAEQNNRKLKEDLEKMSNEIKELEVQAQKDAEMLKKDLTEKAKQDIEKIKVAAKQAIQNEVQSAKFELKQEVVKMAVELAERQLRKQIQQDDQSNLHKDFIEQVGNS
jgi:F-type H+-transporting ATPase subunit b